MEGQSLQSVGGVIKVEEKLTKEEKKRSIKRREDVEMSKPGFRNLDQTRQNQFFKTCSQTA